jgi:predicted TIM-barrel fold metal-dependent hydrolase
MAERKSRPFAVALLSSLFVAQPGVALAAAAPQPIIDMHVHAGFSPREHPVPSCTGNQTVTFDGVDPGRPSASQRLESCAHPIFSETNAVQFRAATIRALHRAGVRRAVLIAPVDRSKAWKAEAPGLFILADAPNDLTNQETERLRSLHASGAVQLFAELGSQYGGVSADDPRLESFWSLAEERDVPVGIHLGLGTALIGDSVRTAPYRAALTSPFQLEQVLKKHPRLRIYVMHAASPMIEEMIAMLFTYPNLYVDVAANDWNMPRAQFYSELKRLVEAGFSKRIMFGSDQTIFPQAIELAIKSIKDAPFLTPAQKRDILYDNAARFLRLTPQQIAADHHPAK